MRSLALALSCALIVASVSGQRPKPRYQSVTDSLRVRGLTDLGAFDLLRGLTTQVGHRLSGSEGDARAVTWTSAKMRELGFENVKLVPCKVPRWERGIERLELDGEPLTCAALGLSVGTPDTGIEAEVVEVGSLEEAAKLGERARGKIVFYNGPMNPTFVRTFEAYGGAVGQRVSGASVAAKNGAVAVLVRSMTLKHDDVAHTGTLRYADDAPQIPAAAVSLVAADRLHQKIKSGLARVRLTLGCRNLPDADSANVIGEIRGSEKPNEVIVLGGHLDSWDKGTGAHDDGAGCVQSMEALRLIKVLGWKPKRTIRVVLFANEESRGRGSAAYLAYAKASGQRHIAAIESDAGGFAPRGFSCSYDGQKIKRLSKWVPALSVFEAERLTPGGGGGADVGPLKEIGTVLFGLEPENQRYFDYHHSDSDTLDKVNPRELELGALAMATLAWLISEEGV